MIRSGLPVLWLVSMLGTIGCREQPAGEPDFVRDVVERGPLRFTVEARPKEVRLGDPIEIRLHMHTPEDYVVQLPAAEDLTNLDARIVDEPDPRPAAAGGLDWRRTFAVERYESGSFEIPPLIAKYARKSAGQAGEPVFEHELVSNPLRIQVRSVLTTQDSVVQPRDITGTLLPPQPRMVWPWVVLGAALVGLAVMAYLLVRAIRRRSRLGPPPILPEVWALQMLRRLRPEVVETGAAREFYYQLSEIVRAYIERKFGLAAPERTTEEFLQTLVRNRRALPYDADRLRVFLEACDIVKYAAYRPRGEDAEQALATARAFVSETAAAARRAVAGTEQVCAPPTGGQAA